MKCLQDKSLNEYTCMWLDERIFIYALLNITDCKLKVYNILRIFLDLKYLTLHTQVIINERLKNISLLLESKKKNAKSFISCL